MANSKTNACQGQTGKWSAALALSMLVGCSAGQSSKEGEHVRTPQRADIEKIEENLRNTPCIGRINDWHRSYFYSMSAHDKKVAETIIDFEFEKGLGDPIRAGISKLPPGGLPKMDDRDILVAHGHFDRRSRQVTLEYCGRNLP